MNIKEIGPRTSIYSYTQSEKEKFDKDFHKFLNSPNHEVQALSVYDGFCMKVIRERDIF